MNMASTDHRTYTLRARAQRQAETRRRIIEATETLHREVGPARTTVAEIARRAGVERLTVYRNFPAVRDLLTACQRSFLAGSPPPSLLPPRSLEVVLRDLYGWYRANQQMERHVHHDRHLVPELDELLKGGADLKLNLAAAAHAGGNVQAGRLIRAALDFSTWELLVAGGASDDEIARLFADAARGLQAEPAS